MNHAVIKKRTRSIGVAAALASGLLLTPMAPAMATSPEPSDAQSQETPITTTEIAPAEIAAIVENMNEVGFLQTKRLTKRALPELIDDAAPNLNGDPDTVTSLSVEAARIQEMADSMAKDGRITVQNVSTEVSSVSSENGIDVVTLLIKRDLGEGDAWEEEAPYAVIQEDMPNYGLDAGSIIPIGSEYVDEGTLPKELKTQLGLQTSTEFEEEALEESAEVPGEGSEEGQPSSTEPLSAEEENKAGAMAAREIGSANRAKVRDYAYKWSYGRNPAYTSYSRDCTNFVSQALRAGGWGQIKGFYQNNNVWWYTGNIGIKNSWTWSGAENFYKFARNESKRATGYSNVYQLRNGDILQYKTTGEKNVTHSMVTTGRKNGVPLLSYHSDNNRDKPFTAMPSGKTWFAHKI